MQITQNEIVAIVLILAILWIWFTWDKTTEGFTDLTIPKGKKWGDYVYYEDDDKFPVASPSISHVDNIPYEQKQQLIQKHEKINDVSGMSETPSISDHVAPFDDNFDFNDSLISKMNQEDNRSQDSVIHELPKSHDHTMQKSEQTLTEQELMPGMEQKKKMEKSLEPKVEQPVIIKPKPKHKKKKRSVKEDRYMALAILLSVLLVGFVQTS